MLQEKCFMMLFLTVLNYDMFWNSIAAISYFVSKHCGKHLPCRCIETRKIRARLMQSVWTIKTSSTSTHVAANFIEVNILFPYTIICCNRNTAVRHLWMRLPLSTGFKIKALLNNRQVLSSPCLKTQSLCDTKYEKVSHLKIITQTRTDIVGGEYCFQWRDVSWLANVQLPYMQRSSQWELDMYNRD